MPNYEFKCQNPECQYVYERLVPIAKYEEEKARGCPECGSPVEQVLYCNISEGFTKNRMISANPNDPQAPNIKDNRSRTGRAQRKMMQDRFKYRNAELDRLTKDNPNAKDKLSKFFNKRGIKKDY